MNCEPQTIPMIDEHPFELRIIMPQGIIGFNDIHHYILTPLTPDTEESLFWELKSVEEPAVSFILISSKYFAMNDPVIAESDLKTAIDPFKVSLKDCEVYLIITIEQDNTGKNIVTANLRAPFVLHPKTHSAWQVVLLDTKYPIAKVI